MKIYTVINLFFLSFLAYLLYCIFPSQILASISSGGNWNIEVDEVNISSVKPEAAKPKTQNAIEDQPPGIYTGKNYIIKTGFDELDPAGTFTFGISNSIVDYGILSPTNSVYRTTNIYISSFKHSYIVRAFQDNPLFLESTKTYIPDTTCDNGYCSEIRSDLWENTLTYGFGYRCDDVKDKSCPIEHNNSNYYKQFADTSKKEYPQVIMSGNSNEVNHEIQITYKINISSSQQIGSYNNKITYIASPGY